MGRRSDLPAGERERIPSAEEIVFQKAFQALRPRTPVPEFVIAFRPYADINNVIRIREEKLVVGLSDMLRDAPRPVLESIAVILIAKLYRKPIPARHQMQYRRFLNRRSVRHRIQALRQVRGRKQVGTPQGEHYNLEEIFEELNQRYFEGRLPKIRLSWSRTLARASLGHYDAAHKTIVISRIFDRPQVPRTLLEYLLYHEMLHVKYPVIHRGARRCFHSPLFRQEERLFPGYREAQSLLETL